MNTGQLFQLFLKFKSVSTDSRQIPANAIFFALKGDHFDGNIYAEKALASGASFAVIDNPAYEKNEKYILVDNVLLSLQQLALYYRRTFNIPVIGITGTNGKTTTKELVHSVLSKKFRTHATSGNLNNHIGVPLTLLSMPADTEVAIIEMGANHPGEIHQLCTIAEPAYGLITNIGRAHLQGFGSFEGVIHTKTELYRWIKANHGKVFLNRDNKILSPFAENLEKIEFSALDHTSFVSGKILEANPFLKMIWKSGKTSGLVNSNLIGSYNLENILAAICIGLHFNVPGKEISDALSAYQPVNNRSQFLKTANNSLLLDAYNANPSSMEASLANFGLLEFHNKTLILGDMLELGEESSKEHQKIIDLVINTGYQHVFLVGPVFASLNTGFPSFPVVQKLREWLIAHPLKDCCILVKGSRGIHLELIQDLL
jgi:UDP-N-acetylmuramoyl-tripeptide--D-alanyl-D-alanine ligase